MFKFAHVVIFEHKSRVDRSGQLMGVLEIVIDKLVKAQPTGPRHLLTDRK